MGFPYQRVGTTTHILEEMAANSDSNPLLGQTSVMALSVSSVTLLPRKPPLTPTYGAKPAYIPHAREQRKGGRKMKGGAGTQSPEPFNARTWHLLPSRERRKTETLKHITVKEERASCLRYTCLREHRCTCFFLLGLSALTKQMSNFRGLHPAFQASHRCLAVIVKDDPSCKISLSLSPSPSLSP